MTILLKQVFAFLKLLNSDKGHNQIAAGIAFGFILGMTPSFSLQTLLVIFGIFIFRVQLGACLLSAFFVSLIAYFLDPLFDLVGRGVLELDALNALWTYLYHLPIIPFTRFYNSIVAGSGAISLALFPFVFFLARFIILKYREKIVERFKETKFFKLVKASSLYKWYAKYESLYGQN